jgi:hypothetical protein
MKKFICVAALFSLISLSASAQDGMVVEEVIVTGSRITDFISDLPPAVTLTKRADFMIQTIKITNDSRHEKDRRREIYTTIAKMLEKAGNNQLFTLGTGEDYFVPLTTENYKLPLTKGKRTDTSETWLLVKAPVNQKASANKIVSSIRDFITSAAKVGRTEILPDEDLGLSIIQPEKYRAEIIKKIAADVKAAANAFGPGYRIRLKGLESPLVWERQGLATMTLYIPYAFEIIPSGS